MDMERLMEIAAHAAALLIELFMAAGIIAVFIAVLSMLGD